MNLSILVFYFHIYIFVYDIWEIKIHLFSLLSRISKKIPYSLHFLKLCASDYLSVTVLSWTISCMVAWETKLMNYWVIKMIILHCLFFNFFLLENKYLIYWFINKLSESTLNCPRSATKCRLIVIAVPVPWTAAFSSRHANWPAPPVFRHFSREETTARTEQGGGGGGRKDNKKSQKQSLGVSLLPPF